jgi:ferredoxin-type protein NapG
MERPISRKDFFRLALNNAKSAAVQILDGAVVAAEMLQEVSAAQRPSTPFHPAWVRPPGALPEKEFSAACTSCSDCIKACPHFAIRKAGPELGKSVAGTPIVVPKDNPCLMCSDYPCIAACSPKALILPLAEMRIKIGIAVVNPRTCYQAQGQPCDYCMMHCPEKPKAISAVQPGTLPTVDLQTCTGCGKCAQICPADAVEIQVLREVPS